MLSQAKSPSKVESKPWLKSKQNFKLKFRPSLLSYLTCKGTSPLFIYFCIIISDFLLFLCHIFPRNLHFFCRCYAPEFDALAMSSVNCMLEQIGLFHLCSKSLNVQFPSAEIRVQNSFYQSLERTSKNSAKTCFLLQRDNDELQSSLPFPFCVDRDGKEEKWKSIWEFFRKLLVLEIIIAWKTLIENKENCAFQEIFAVKKKKRKKTKCKFYLIFECFFSLQFFKYSIVLIKTQIKFWIFIFLNFPPFLSVFSHPKTFSSPHPPFLLSKFMNIYSWQLFFEADLPHRWNCTKKNSTVSKSLKIFFHVSFN